MRGKECVTDYFLRAEAASTSLKSAGETISDSLLIAMVLKGLPEEFTPFNTVVMQKDTESTFPEFKSLLRSYEESLRSREAHRPDVKSENVLKVNYKKNPDYQCGGSASGSSVRCYSCGKTGHKSFECKLKKDRDGARCKNIVKGKGKAKIVLYDTNGIKQNVVLDNALYIPNFKQNIFSVQSAVSKGATVSFNPNHSELISPNGVSFEINKKGKLYYLNNVNSCKSHSLEEWHKVLGHCNVKDILKLEDKAEGMKISAKNEHSEINTDLTETEREGESRYPSRERTAPKYLEEYVDPDNVDLLGYSVHYCCKVTEIPESYREALNSHVAHKWIAAMDDEIQSLRDNNTYELS
ncbi:uncharacterized protein [Palaemon carinicauda]|uniref:uncharacterized protein n=1 Tax=Palaemon carinicauda TaxID=392227 RepID=UPI0035B5E824